MPRVTVGTTPRQILRPNPKRIKWEVQFVPSSIIAGNTGLVFISRGGPAGGVADLATADETLNAGASTTENLKDGSSEERVKDEVWAVSDTAGQIINVSEDIELK